MLITVFGLTMSSSWGNGHATLWRGLVRALVGRGCRVVFYEKNETYYAANRDLVELDGAELVIYDDWADIAEDARRRAAASDAVIVTSYCPDGVIAGELACNAPRPKAVFYDMDTPVSLAALQSGQRLPWLGQRALADYDLVLSFTGGPALEALRTRLGARRAAALYGHVDPGIHRPEPVSERYRSDLSYLGTYAQDRQSSLVRLFVEPARQHPNRRFLIGGAQYPDTFPWSHNMYFVRHLPPHEHPSFFSSSRLTLNVTRRAMADMGWCPSGRIFEAAACRTPVLSDVWDGVSTFYEPGREILLARDEADVGVALDLTDAQLSDIAQAAYERTLRDHTAARRADELLSLLHGEAGAR